MLHDRTPSTWSLAAAFAMLACGPHPNIQCGVDSDCNLHFGGECTSAPTGSQWCSYPDPVCPSGMRYSDQQIGDGVSGQCVSVQSDAGVDAPSAAPATSCIALPHTCGVNGDDDCCASPVVPGGTYFRSFDVAGDSFSGDMNWPATVSSFRLDKYEVTVSRFRAFVESNQGTQDHPPATGAGTHPHLPGSGWQASWTQFLRSNKAALLAHLNCFAPPFPATWTDLPSSNENENRPINCLNWYDAFAFCAWDGGYLPTEAEWNYAAAGGDEQRAYPWSIPAGDTTLDTSYTSYDCMADGTAGCALTDINAVGTRPKGDGRWTQSDLAGNVMEWALDLKVPYRNPCTDCAGLGARNGAEQVLRGGNWIDSPPQWFRAGFRLSGPEEEALADRGVRCARSL